MGKAGRPATNSKNQNSSNHPPSTTTKEFKNTENPTFFSWNFENFETLKFSQNFASSNFGIFIYWEKAIYSMNFENFDLWEKISLLPKTYQL